MTPPLPAAGPAAPGPAAAPVTLADVAARCNLSKASVSRALSMSEADCPLSAKTRERVRRVGREMGYRVNVQARALASGRSMAIGLLYEGTMPILNSVYQRIVGSFSSTLREAGYHLVMLGLDQEGQWEDWLLGGRLDGAVCLHAVPDAVERVLERARLPVVLLNGRSNLVTGTVSVDDRAGAGLITEHLVGLGHRRLLFVTDTGHETPHYSIAERQTGFLEAAAAAGLARGAARCFEGDAAAFASAWAGFKQKPTAVIGYSHVEAVSALRVLRQAGVNVPAGCSLATFNDVFPVADLSPALTCVTTGSAAMGTAGGRMLLDALVRPERPASDDPAVVVQPTLILRESTTAPRG